MAHAQGSSPFPPPGFPPSDSFSGQDWRQHATERWPIIAIVGITILWFLGDFLRFVWHNIVLVFLWAAIVALAVGKRWHEERLAGTGYSSISEATGLTTSHA